LAAVIGCALALIPGLILFATLDGICARMYEKTKGRFGGLPWVCIGLSLQWAYWELHYAPLIPLVKPSIPVQILFGFTAAGIWLFARTRTTSPWKWAVVGLVPVVGPVFAVARLGLMPLGSTTKPTVRRSAVTVLIGYLLLLGGTVPLVGHTRSDAVHSPDGNARVVITRTGLVDINDMSFEWQRLSGPFVTESQDIYTTPRETYPPLTVHWSPNGSRILVTGSRFEVVESGERAGERLYLMYDVTSRRLWTNAKADRREPVRFGGPDVAHVSWIPSLM
jgi:hypothetical protein